MKTKKISSQFFRSYLSILLVFLIFCAISFFVYQGITESRLNQSSIDFDAFIQDYEKNPDTAFSNQPFQSNDFILVTDRDYKILDAVNIELTDSITYYDLQFELGNDEVYANYIFQGLSDDRVYHLYLAPIEDNLLILISILIATFGAFLVFAVYYARQTGRKIIHPIEKLSKGVQEIQKGNYDYHIDYKTNTELDIIKDEINQMSQHLKEEIQRRQHLEKERSTLMMNLSHDIKTPLTNILGYSQSLLQEDLPKPIQEQVNFIHRYGQSAANLTEELFSYSRINSQLILPLQREDLVEVTRRKLIEYVQEFESLNIRYSFEIPESPILCPLNQPMFARVLDNLIQNTMKYNHDNFAFAVRIRQSKEKVKLIVEDDGIGIPAEYQENIFDPLVRVESSRNRSLGGTGLGLAIAKQIIEKHKGTIRLDPTHKKGCRFIIILPTCSSIDQKE